MIVKIGNKVYNSDNASIAIRMTDKKKELLNNNFIKIKTNKFCIYPMIEYWNGNTYKRISEFMKNF